MKGYPYKRLFLNFLLYSTLMPLAYKFIFEYEWIDAIKRGLFFSIGLMVLSFVADVFWLYAGRAYKRYKERKDS